MKRLTLLAVTALLLGFAGTAHAQDAYTVVAGGLDNPRGLTFTANGRLYVAQAGTGEADGRITEINLKKGTITDIVTGLPSLGSDEGEVLGVSGLSAQGANIYAMMSLSNAATGFDSLLGHLLKVTPSGNVKEVANVGDFMYQWTTDHENLFDRDFPDSNPYGVLAAPGGVYVADAGANTLSIVRSNGRQQVLAYFPNNVTADATPTCIAKGPDGALYIGTLSLVDSLVLGPSAVVYRVDPSKVVADDLSTILSVAERWATGLHPINGCAFGPNGDLYVSELITGPGFSGGDVVKIPFGNPSLKVSLTNQTLTFGGGIAVDSDGTVYAVTGTIDEGAVVRLNSK